MTDFGLKWSCEYCTYENWPSAIKCTMCRAQRHNAPIITEEPFKSSSSLDPQLCTTQLICPDSSARPRVRIADELPETSSKWSCHMCTYLNWPRAIRCTQCLSQRQQGSQHGPLSPSEAPQTSDSGSRPSPVTSDPCEEYNDRNRLNMHAQRWPCLACTYENWPKSLRCVVCDHPKPSSSPEAPQQDSEAESAMSLSIVNEQERDNLRTGDLAAVEAYKSSGGDIARQLTADEVRILNRPSAFDAGFTLVHLAIRFQRQDMLAVLLTEVSQQTAKCIPALVCPELTEQIRREVAAALHRRKGEFPCYFFTDLVTFTLPADIEDLPPNVQEKLFDEVLDRDVQKELEEESPIINWSLELGTRLDSRLYALWNRTAGDCLLDSVLQATWGIYDKDSVLRKSLNDSLHDCSHWFYTRWKEWESWYSQSFGLHFSLREEQWQEDWAFILSLASQPGASLEQTHVFVLAHILRRPIIVYGVKYYKSFRGETLGYTRFQGVYLPLLWEQSFCWKSPIALGYTRGHFSALVAMENDGYDNRGAGANLNTDDDVTVTFLPLVDSERKLLHIHFLSAQEMGTEEQQERMLRQWMDCCVTEGGVLVAMQKSSRRRNHPLVTQMVEKWLDGYRQLAACPTLSDGEEEEEDEDE
uniref:ubiquitinyl hydrolase 1 n=1 Tax=Sinocyclocheilus rhinocerous TaxID=307959 RepID=A0A673MME3_9TELE